LRAGGSAAVGFLEGARMTISEKLLRRTLYFTVAYNLMGFFTFLMPQTFGGMAGLPASVPFLHSGFVASNILLFGLVGLWQARRPMLDAPVLTIFGLSKAVFCLLMLISWRLGEIALPGFLMSLVDLAMGAIFLVGARSAERWNAEKREADAL
jgi:hypothetical protein